MRPIVFLHGLGSTKNDFQKAFIVEGLEDHTLLAFDFPGSGKSSYPQELSVDADDLVEITNTQRSNHVNKVPDSVVVRQDDSSEP
jgi:pimeloyl-ACP methyl ester carboxylesterase